MLILFVLLYGCAFSTLEAWYTGPDGKIALEGTPEYEANRYLKKIFVKYGVALNVSGEMGNEVMSKLMSDLGLGVIHKLPSSEVPGEGNNGHEHRRKKRSLDQPLDVNIFSDSVSSVPHDHEELSPGDNTTDCRSVSLLLREYKLDQSVTPESGIGSYQFGMLCPALIYLTVEETCIEHEKDEKTSPSTSSVWGYGFLSVTVISLLSFLGVIIVPLISNTFFDSLLSVLVAGAVGALCGDALLHLIPHSQSSSHDLTKEPVFKNLVVLLGIYFLFVIEGIMKLCQNRNRKKKKSEQNVINMSARTSRTESDGGLQVREIGDGERVYIPVEVNSNHKEEEKDFKTTKDHHDHHETHAHNHHHGDFEGKGVASMAWMVIAGDGMHNFSDGVAIGAAFAANVVGGVSTSIAVFCHELPHELGDFALLLKAGMSVKQALLYNGFAACLGYLGLMVGILIGNFAASVTPWIFAITAGMFLYVALADMLPEMNSGMHEMTTKTAISTFVLQNVGLIVGIGIMLLISIYEEELKFGA